MLILLPPSETKTPRRRGAPLKLERLSFPGLTRTRSLIADTLAAASAGPDACHRLGISPGVAAEVARNVDLRTSPAQMVADLYTGVLYDALDLASLDSAATRRARRWIVVQSALFGALRLGDKVPAYRLSMSTKLPGLAPLAAIWRPELDTEMTAAAGRGVIVDCRSSTYAAAWHPGQEQARRWVRIVVPGATHMAKHTRGLVTRHLVETGTDARSPAALRDVLATRFEVALQEPARATVPWDLSVTPA
ncbi:YaaA family protein [Rudaeicoccus suwonensis]|uniref:Peroxide stress protein YaaA n=1 Tax=Rudaeicoccus suwonensis TaxID=657409 RepID=A0A561E9Y9_9MICO|nr:peroxide stress protein YaaA [Rudaeicoccus suwonensis]TWE12426.1 hypothetical protein BKA23_1233 [Rudaeicoccus suwonensis]